MKFCVDCKHHFIVVTPKRDHRHMCNRLLYTVRNIVTGTTEPRGSVGCEHERAQKGACGPEGKYWEKKDD